MTSIAFVPNTTSPFVFQPVLDGTVYQGIVTWALWGQRWYLNLYANAGPLVFSKPVIGSIDPVVATLTTQAGLQTAFVESAVGLLPAMAIASPLLQVGTSIQLLRGETLRLSRAAAAAGSDAMAVFDLSIDLLWGYGFQSTMIFRASSQTFEVTP